MPRPPRISIPDITLHVVQRGNDRCRTFFADEDYRTYLLLLDRISERYESRIHAYVLMSNHVHLLMTSSRVGGISATMQQLGSSYTRYVNRQYGRTGTLWEGRFRSSAVASDFYCLACYRYIELNPVRAGIVKRAVDYRWSSHRDNIGQRSPSLCNPHPSFRAIAADERERARNYRSMFSVELQPKTIAEIRDGMNRGAAIGTGRFMRELERQTGMPVRRRRRGRPRKANN